MKLNLLLFSDNTWAVCYDNQIDETINYHHWRSDVLRAVKILDAVAGEDRCLESDEEFSERVNPSLKANRRRSAGQIVMEAMFAAYDQRMNGEGNEY